MTFNPQTNHEKILHRLQIARGHLEKVLEMFEAHQPCADILHQSHAVSRALEEADVLIMEHHLTTCAASAIREKDPVSAISEIVSVFKKSK